MDEDNIEDYSDYLVIFDIPASATAVSVVCVFEQFGEIESFCFVGKVCHIGRAFIKFTDLRSRDNCLQMSGYNDFSKPAYETIVSSIYVENKPVIVTPIQEKEAVLLRRKEKKTRNMHLLKIGNDVGESFFSGEDELRRTIIENRERVFFMNANFSISKKTLCFYNCPKNMNKGLIREVFREGVENFCQHNRGSEDAKKNELAKQIDTKKIRITQVKYHEDDGTTTITFATHQQAMAALIQLNGDANAFRSFRPIIHFDLRKKELPFPGADIIPDHPFIPPPPHRH